MKLQHLIVIFIIIILPISLVLTSYLQNQVKTLQLQISYDTKLKNSTYDALKAFQLNTVNSSTSDLSNSKMRDIEAAVNTFFNSVANNFSIAGYNQEVLKDYVPAIVFTMYDGYYIYSPFENTLTSDDHTTSSTYQNGETVTSLKPYIFYSCRYVTGNIDVVITYSLDNYITIQGTINNQSVYRYGYLLDNITGDYDPNTNSNSIRYRGIPISTETLTEYVDDSSEQTSYTKVNGVKYYLDSSNGRWYSRINDQKYYQGINYKTENDSALRYYDEAKDFTNWVKTNLGDLRVTDAVFENGESTKRFENEDGSSVIQSLAERELWGNSKIFESDINASIEDPDSNFNQHRLQVIRYSIEKNLSIAIANYNNYDGGNSNNFLMPELQENEWERILNNVSIISFLQGLNIGGKIYNGYSIVTNTKTEEVVNTDSIYITTSDGQYHRATDAELVGNTNITRSIF